VNATPMINHSFWHQRSQYPNTMPVCPICMNQVQFNFGDNVLGWTCHLGHPVMSPVYAPVQFQACPYPTLHAL
jgi:hypothetical protein